MMNCDIVLTVYDNLMLTKQCLDSLVKHWRLNDRLIIVDNASHDQTKDYLLAFQAMHLNMNIKIIRFDSNLGFIKAANAGLKENQRDAACLLSNDTQVTPGWLDNMCDLMEKEADIGIINPLSSTFGVYPKKNQPIDILAVSLEKFKGQYTETASCVGFCMLIKNDLLRKIGYLDEVFEQGYFEDTDYSRRAIANGFRCVLAKSSYVWHKEHSTFLSKDREALFSKNREIFHSRWGKPQRILCVFNNIREYNSFTDFINFCINLARKGNWPWVIAPKNFKDDFDKLKIHGNIRAFFIAKPMINLFSLGLLIKRRKKRFDSVYINKNSYRIKNLMNIFFKGQIKEMDYEKQC